MRFFFFLMLLAGAGAAFGYPWYFTNLSGYEIGSYPAYRKETGFQPVTIPLITQQSPVRVFVDISPIAGYYPDQARTMLTLTASINGRTVLAEKLDYVATSAESRKLESVELVFRDSAGDLYLSENGKYKFVLGEGDVEGLQLGKADLILRAEAQEGDPRVQPAGFAALAIGLVGMIRSGRRRRRDDNETRVVPEPPKEPEKPKWGRDASGES